MNKFIFILFALILPCFVLTSCGDDDPEYPESSGTSSGSTSGTVRIASVKADPKMVANVSGRYYNVVVTTSVPATNVVGFSLYYGKDKLNVRTPAGVSSLRETSHTFNAKLPRNSQIYLQAKAATTDGTITSSLYSLKTN